MSEQPATLASEAKKIHQGLKDLLKSKEPYDKEIDFQRKSLRRRYLHLLLVHPYAPESKDAENHLWMQTSYAFISAYKQRVAALDRQTQNKQQQQQQTGRNNNPHGPVVEYRKLLQRFRQFLAEEEKFWTQFLVRFSRAFTVQEAEPALVALGILSTGTDGKVIEHAPTDHGRNHFQFPLESTSPDILPTTPTQLQSRMAIISKALICLGDIARYREQYNESGGRPRAGHDDTPNRRGRNRRANSLSSENVPRPRNFDKSRHCYEQARALVPNEGNPSHQLAILSNYQKDHFASLVHYYRALCVQQPYDTASENMGTILNKAFEQWKQKDNAARDTLSHIPKVRIETLKEREVVLHALWRIGLDKTDTHSLQLARTVHEEFALLVSERHLPEDLIIDFVVLSQSALWNLHTLRERPTHFRSKSSAPARTVSLPLIEARMVSHILALHKALLSVGIDQLKEPPPVDAAENDLAQRITAVFRRTLPALRIASKWLKANYTYLTTRSSQLKGDVAGIDDESIGLPVFWEVYAQFSRSLSRLFPTEKLPTMAGPLEEDIEMKGFLPLQEMIKDDMAGQKQDQVHPNVLQLMRIADLLDDATSLVKMQDSPIALYGNHFVLKGVEAIPIGSNNPRSGSVTEHNLLQSIRDNRVLERPDEDELTELTSRTEDDPVRDAFRHLDTSDKEVEEDDEDDEEDEIVYLRSPASPALLPSQSPTRSPISPAKQNITPSPASPTKGKSPYQTPTMPPLTAATTAQDLLNNMMGRSPIVQKNTQPASLLFGSEPRQSIWSVAQDEPPLKFSSGVPISGNHSSFVSGFPEPASQYVTATTFRPPVQQLAGVHQRALSSTQLHGPEVGNNAFVYSSLPSNYTGHVVPFDSNYHSQHVYAPSTSEGQHARHLSFQDHRPMFVPPTMSPLWGAGG